MKKTLLCCALAVLSAPIYVLVAQNANSTTTANANSTASANNTKKSSPIFRATTDQIKRAQVILKQRGFYDGEETGKLDTTTRAGLRKYQTAEGIKETGTLNRGTLEKMGIELTDTQKAM